MDRNKIADVLEEAARLYKDEKVEWCSGSWVEPSVEGLSFDDTVLETETMSACAEGALLRAAGFSWLHVRDYPENMAMLRKINPEATELYHAAREKLSRYLFTHRNEYFVTSGAITTRREVLIPHWNDSMVSTMIDAAFAEGTDLLAIGDLNNEAKNVVIHAMEATAKDLRNG